MQREEWNTGIKNYSIKVVSCTTEQAEKKPKATLLRLV